MERSEFVANHEFIGTSILLVADEKGKTGAYWIDFAKTEALQEGTSISHRKEWEPGNHEDGILLGLDNLIAAWTEVLHTADVACNRKLPDEMLCTLSENTDPMDNVQTPTSHGPEYFKDGASPLNRKPSKLKAGYATSPKSNPLLESVYAGC